MSTPSTTVSRRGGLENSGCLKVGVKEKQHIQRMVGDDVYNESAINRDLHPPIHLSYRYIFIVVNVRFGGVKQNILVLRGISLIDCKSVKKNTQIYC